jgi:hypothetical protein
MEVFPHTIQYLQCMNCQRLLGKGSLICELGHPLCTQCGTEGDQCSTCSRYTSDAKTFTSNLRKNVELWEILTKCFARCKNCENLFPLSKFEKHCSRCTNNRNEIGCFFGCGKVTKNIGKHLIDKHEYSREENFEEDVLKIYSSTEEWGESVWRETVLFFDNNSAILVHPKVEKEVFSVAMFNISSRRLRLKVKAVKGWSSSLCEVMVPMYGEKIVKTHEPVFWNCEINTLKKSYLESDSKGNLVLNLRIKRID